MKNIYQHSFVGKSDLRLLGELYRPIRLRSTVAVPGRPAEVLPAKKKVDGHGADMCAIAFCEGCGKTLGSALASWRDWTLRGHWCGACYTWPKADAPYIPRSQRL